MSITFSITNLPIQTARLRAELKRNIPYIPQPIRLKRFGFYINGIGVRMILRCAKLSKLKPSDLSTSYFFKVRFDLMAVVN
jgi:hypothetical protein